MVASLLPARRRLVLVVCALAVLAAVGTLAAVLLRRDAPVRPVNRAAQPPIVLVPGYGGSTAALDVLAGTLKQSGRDSTVVQLAGDGTGDLRLQAEVLQTAVRAAMARADASTVDVVGYSAGGVTARLWVREFRGGDVARRVLTLGAPHHGTDLAGFARDFAPNSCPLACRQLAPDSALLRSLNAGDETPAGPTWVSLWTSDDRAVLPPESARLTGALAFPVQSVCPAASVTHADLPQNPSVGRMVVQLLGQGRPTTPGAEVCSEDD